MPQKRINMFDRINHYISNAVELSPQELEYFDAALSFKRVPKKTVLLKAGEICDFEAYVCKGCVREYYIDENGAEVTLHFAVEDWWVSEISSFHEQVPSLTFIETLEDCELLIITRSVKEELLLQIPQLERMFRLMLQRHLHTMKQRLIKTMSFSAMARYQEFLRRYPSIPQRVPQHYIASYLGISAEFLSKLRARQPKL